MKLRHRIYRGIAATGLALAFTFGQPAFNTKNMLPPAHAQTVKQYNPDTNPLEAGTAVKALAKKAEAGSPLETAKKLHKLLQKFRLVSSGRTLARDDRPPRTAEETARERGGDCSDLVYSGIAAAKELPKELESPSGLTVIRVKGPLRHVLQYVEIGGKKHLLDPQTKEFGKGTIQLGRKRLTFTYEELKKSGRIIMELDSEQAKALYHAEWGTYLKNIKGRRTDALHAFKKAVEICPSFTRAKNELLHLQEAYVVFLANRGVVLMNNKQYGDALRLFEKAKANYPASLKDKAAAMLKRLDSYINICKEKLKENN